MHSVPHAQAQLPQRLLWVVACLALATLPHLGHLGIWIVLIAGGAAGLRFVIAIQQRPLPPRALRILIAFGALVSVLATYRTLNGIEAGTALLVLMAGLKLLETQSTRDLTVVVFLSYFLLFAGFLYDQSLLRLPLMLLTTWLLTATLMRLHQSTGTISNRTALALTGEMLLQALPIAALLFIFLPRLPGQFWALPPRNAATTGLSDEMSPGDVTQLSLSDEIAFRVKFDGDLPTQADRYWRGPVLHDFDGRTWRRLPRFLYVNDPITLSGPSYSYRITIEPYGRHWIFALDMPIAWPQGNVRRTYDYQLVTTPINTVTSYQLQSVSRYSTGLTLRQPIARADTFLPVNRNLRSRDFALQLRAQARTDVDFVNAVLRYFATEPFYYTLEPPPLGADSVDDFLFNTRRGFCEHFSSAFTVLMRSVGIPARVVTGYQGGEYNPMGGYLIVRQSDAHAWSEVWLRDKGWVRVDPTAAVAPERVQSGLDAALPEDERVLGRTLRRSTLLIQARLAWDAVNAFWNNRIVEFSIDQQRALLTRIGVNQVDWRTLGLALAAVIVISFAALSLYLAYQFKPRLRDPVAAVYLRLCERLAKHGLARASHEGPIDYLARVATSRPDLHAILAEIRSLYIALRYGPSPLPNQLSRLKYLVSRVRI